MHFKPKERIVIKKNDKCIQIRMQEQDKHNIKIIKKFSIFNLDIK